MVKTKKPSKFEGCWANEAAGYHSFILSSVIATIYLIYFYTFSRKWVKQENKFKLPLYSNTGFNDKVEIQLLTLQFCFSSHNTIWEKFDTLYKTKQSCPSAPFCRPVVNLAVKYYSEQEEIKGNTRYYNFFYYTDFETATPPSISIQT